jgi:hypothetical protein
MKKKAKTDFAKAYDVACIVRGGQALLAAFRARISKVKLGNKIIGYNIRRDGKIIAGPFWNERQAIEWAFMAYGPLKQ